MWSIFDTCVLISLSTFFFGFLSLGFGHDMVWKYCNYIVSANVLSVQMRPEYGQCLVYLNYTTISYPFSEFISSVEMPCSGVSNTSKSFVTGCYNHYHPEQFKTYQPTTKVYDETFNHVRGLITFNIGCILAIICLVSGMAACIIYMREEEEEQANNKTKKKLVSYEKIANGIPIGKNP
jgi:hypothetical protein